MPRDASVNEPNLADDFAARVPHRPAEELVESRRKRRGQHVEHLENPNHGRELRALSTVVDLDRNADPLFRNRDRNARLPRRSSRPLARPSPR